MEGYVLKRRTRVLKVIDVPRLTHNSSFPFCPDGRYVIANAVDCVSSLGVSLSVSSGVYEGVPVSENVNLVKINRYNRPKGPVLLNF